MPESQHAAVIPVLPAVPVTDADPTPGADSFIHTAREVARFASENPWRSWAEVLPTLVATVAIQAALFMGPPQWLAPLLSTALVLLLVRVFIFFHDILHRALFRHSRLGRWLLMPFSIYFVYPPWVWRDRHLDHHRHNCQLDDDSVDGQVPLFSTDEMARRSPAVRLGYRAIRSWPGMILGYIPYFIVPVAMAARKQPLAILWPLAQIGIMVASVYAFGFTTAFWAVLYPIWMSTIFGTVLFFVQHNAPGLEFRMPGEWQYGHAALRSSSYLDLNRWQHWITGNIGYHHIHHINDRVPFYRLPEVMAAVPAVQDPIRVRLTLGDVHRCLRLQLWDPLRGRLISWSEWTRTTDR